MPRGKKFTAEQIIGKLREAEVELSRGKKVPEMCRKLGATEQIYYRWAVNHNRVERIWRQEGRKVPKRQAKRRRLGLNDGSCIRLRPAYRNRVWSDDFVADRTADGQANRVLTIVDDAYAGVPVDRRGPEAH